MRKMGWIVMIMIIFSATAWAAGNTPSAPEKVFSLDDCLKMAFANNHQLLAASQTVKIYEQEVKRARAALLPVLSYSAGSYEDYQYRTEAGTLNNPYFTKELTLSHRIFDGGIASLNHRNAKLNLTMALEDKRKTEQSLAYQIKTAFYDMWLKQQNLITAQASESAVEKHYQLVYRKYKAGTANKLELYEVQGQWEEQKVATATAKNELAQSRLILANLMNIDRFLEFTAAYDLARFEPVQMKDDSLTAMGEEACHNRPDMHKARLAVEVAENNLKMQKAKVLPTLTVSYDYSVDSKKFSDNDGTRRWYLLFNLSGKLYDGFDYQAGVAVNQQNLELAKLQEEMQRNQIFFEVTQSLQSLQQNRDLIQATRLQVNFMKERVNLIALQYKNGRADTTDFISAQTALDKAQNRYYAQIMSYLTALAKLDYAMGREPVVQREKSDESEL